RRRTPNRKVGIQRSGPSELQSRPAASIRSNWKALFAIDHRSFPFRTDKAHLFAAGVLACEARAPGSAANRPSQSETAIAYSDLSSRGDRRCLSLEGSPLVWEHFCVGVHAERSPRTQARGYRGWYADR